MPPRRALAAHLHNADKPMTPRQAVRLLLSATAHCCDNPSPAVKDEDDTKTADLFPTEPRRGRGRAQRDAPDLQGWHRAFCHDWRAAMKPLPDLPRDPKNVA